MTIEKYYGLTSAPFPKQATDACLLRNPAMEAAIDRLHFALSRDTPAMLVAESGCGKSTLMALFARSLAAADYNIVSISLTTLAPFSLISSLCVQTGVHPRRMKGETASALIAHLRGLPKRTVLLVDEAHLMPDDTLEDLRLLTADDFDRKSPFALVLVGQPLLRDRLAEPRHNALCQRASIRVRLRPLNQTEVAAFIDGHLKSAGAKKNPFEPDAISAIFQHSRGIARLIQNIALQTMLLAMEAGAKTIDAATVQQAVVDLEAI